LTPPYHLPNIHPEPNGSVVKHGNTETVQYENTVPSCPSNHGIPAGFYQNRLY